VLSGGCVKIDKYRECTCIELYQNEEGYKDDLMLIQIIYESTEGKKLFVDLYGDIDDKEKKYIIAQKPQKQRFRTDLWMRREWIKDTVSIEEDELSLFFCDNDYEWERYLCDVYRYGFSILRKETRLYLIASFGECTPPTIYCRNDNPIIDNIINIFGTKGYRIVRKSHWF
jgi:hypothetical protein